MEYIKNEENNKEETIPIEEWEGMLNMWDKFLEEARSRTKVKGEDVSDKDVIPGEEYDETLDKLEGVVEEAKSGHKKD